MFSGVKMWISRFNVLWFNGEPGIDGWTGADPLSPGWVRTSQGIGPLPRVAEGFCLWKIHGRNEEGG